MKQWLIVLLSFVLASWGTTAKSQVTVDFANRIGATSFDYANGVTVDAQGNIYVTGSFSGTNALFGLNANNVAVTRTSFGNEDIFVAKYSPNGRVLWVQTAGAPGNNADRGQKLEVDDQGNLYVVGFFSGTATFSPSVSRAANGDDDAFVAKYNASTGALVWVATYGGSQKDRANAIDFDDNGNIYVTGFFQGQMTVGGNTLNSSGDNDIYSASWDGNGNLRWIGRSGSSAVDEGEGITVSGNDVYSTGRFSGTAEFTNPGGTTFSTIQAAGLSDVFVTKRNATTGALVWAVRGGGIQSDYAYDIIPDGMGNVVVAGRFSGLNVSFASRDIANTTLSSVVGNTGPTDDMFLIKYSGDGNVLWAKTAGGTLIDYATGLDVDVQGRVTVSGQFQGSFDWNGNAANRVTSNGNYDVFYAVYDSNGNFVNVLTYGGNSDDRSTDHIAYATTSTSMNLVATGLFFNSIRFGNQPLLLSDGQSDGFVVGLTVGTPAGCELPIPSISAGQPQGCSQTLTAVNTTGATFIEWLRDGIVIPGANLSTFTATQGGNYAVRISNALPNCNRTSLSVAVNINSNISVSAGNNVSINTGQTATLTAVASGSQNVSFTWTNLSNNQVVGNTASINVSPANTTTFQVVARDNVSGCSAASTVTVNVIGSACLTSNDVMISIIPGNDNVPATALTAEICIGQSSSFQASTLLGNTRYNYQWFRVNTTGGNDILASNLNLPILETQSIPGTYYLRLTDNTGACPQVRSGNELVIEVYPIPSVTASSNQVGGGCTDQPITLTAQGSGGTPFNPANQPQNGDVNGYRYSWQPADAIVGSSNSNVVTANPTVATTFTVQVQDRIQCGNRTTVNANPALPNITITADGSTSFCTGGSVNLFVSLSSGNPGAFTYIWARNGQTIVGQSGTSINVTTGGNYTATLVSNVAGCPNRISNTITVTVGTGANANAGVDRTICLGGSTTIGTTAIAGVTYSWSPNFGLSNPNAAVTNVSGLAPGTYVFTLAASSANCPASFDDVVVTVLDVPAPQIATNDPTVVCEGVVNLFVVNPIAGVNYSWRRNGVPVSSGNSTSYTATMTGDYSVVATNVVGGTNCPGTSNTISVTVNMRGTLPIPKIQPFGSANINICTGGMLELFVADSYFELPEVVAAGGVDVRWLHYPQGEQGDFTVVGVGRRVSISQPGIYFAQAFAGSEDCSNKKSEGLFVTRSDASAPMLTLDGDKTICPEASACLTAELRAGRPGTANITSLEVWNMSTGMREVRNDLNVEMSEVTFCVKPLRTTTYEVRITDSFGCTAQAWATVNVNSIPAPVIPEIGTFCSNSGLQTVVSAGFGYNAFQWQNRVAGTQTWNPVTGIIGHDSLWIDPAALLGATLATRTWEYRLIASIEGCPFVSSNIVSVTVNRAPSVSLTATPAAVCNGATSTLRATINRGAGVTTTTTSTWWNGETTTSLNPTMVVTPTFETEFSITAVNTNGCSATGAVTVGVVFPQAPVVNGGGTICAGESIELMSATDNIGAISRQWQSRAGTVGTFTNIAGANTENLTVVGNFTGTREYRVVYTNLCGTFTSNATSVTVNTRPTVTAAVRENPICYGEPIRLYNSVGASANVTYTWIDQFTGAVITNNAGTFSSPNVIAVGDQFYIATNDTLTTWKTYVLRAEFNTTGCFTESSVTVNVDRSKGPEAYAEADRDVVCEGTAVNITATNLGNNINQPNVPANQRFYTYRWNGPNGLISAGTINYPNRTVPGITTGPLYRTTTYTLTLTDPNNTCVSECHVRVEVGQRLVATIQRQGGENLCEGNVTLRAISNTGLNVNYQWYTDVDGNNNWTMIPGATAQTFMPIVGGRYNVRVIDPAYPACYDDADNWVTLTGVRSDMRANDLVVNSQFGKPVVQNMPAIVCSGRSIRLEARYIFGASYQWYRLDGPASSPQYTLLNGEFDRFLTVSQPGRFVVQVTAGCFSCPDVCEIWSQVCPVIVVPNVSPTVHHVGRVELCPDPVTGHNSVELYTQGDVRQYAYQWFHNNVAVAGATEPRMVTTEAGTYTVRVTSRFDQTNGTNCWGMSSNSVTVVPCSTFVCPSPVSVGATVDPFNPTWARLHWGQPLNTSGNGGSLNRLTGDYIAEYRAVGSTTWNSTTPVVTVNATWIDVMGLTPDTQYEVRVRTICTENMNSEWAMGMFRTPFGVATACPTPNQPTVSNIGITSATLNWNNLSASGVTDYEYQWSVAGQNNWTALVRTTATSGLMSPLAANTQYEARVRSVCGGTNVSAFSSVVTFTTLSDVDPVPCNDPLAEPVVEILGPNNVEIAWVGAANAAPNGVIFALALDVDFTNIVPGFDFVQIDEFTLNPDGNQEYLLPLTGLNAGTTYFYSIQAMCVNGTAPTVFFGSFQTNNDGDPVGTADCLPTFFGIQELGADGQSVTVSWNSVQGATGYVVRYRRVGTAGYTQVPTNNTTLTINGLDFDTNYEIGLRTIVPGCNDPRLENGFLPSILFTTLVDPTGVEEPQACAQPGLTPFTIACNGINQRLTVNLVPVPGVLGYEFQYRDLSQPESSWLVTDIDGNPLLIDPNVTTFEIGAPELAFATNRIYGFRLRAVCDATSSSRWANAVVVSTDCGAEGKVETAVSSTTDLSFSVYPNPNKGEFTVSFESEVAGHATVRLMDMTGRTVMSRVADMNAGLNTINVNGAGTLTSGLYVIHVQVNGQIQTAKLIVE